MSKIRFEHINGTLCRMVEPEPLTPKAAFPCVVRLIQDDSPMGRFNKMHSFTGNILQNTYLAQRATDYSKHANDGKMPINCYAHYEIIGYPVTAHSAEWALYQMMQGKWVVCDGLHPPCHLHADMVTWMVSKSPARWEMQSPDKWVLYCATNTGWQLYEPKPLLADAQAGDLCKHRNGDWSQIIDTNGTYIPGQPIRTTLKDTNGINRNFCLSGSHFTMQFGGEYDIIATEPLAPKGTAEWAWQMLILQKPVSHPAEGIWRDTYYSKDGFVRCMAKTGWQLYEEKPLLADAKVGDLCKTDLDEWIQIDDTSEPPSPILYHFDRPFNGNIIHTEPLAPKGSDKWGWQMLLIGKKISNEICPKAYQYVGDDGFIMLFNGKELVKTVWHIDKWIKSVEYDKALRRSGWQLYEPNPLPMASTHDGLGDKFLRDCLKPNEHPIITGYNRLDYVPVEGIRIPIEPEPNPAYAVGDLVEIKHKNGDVEQGVIKEIRDLDDIFVWFPRFNLTSHYGLRNGVWTYFKPWAGLGENEGSGWGYDPSENNVSVRKISPSEVVVNIGCLSGTVRQCGDKEEEVFALHAKNNAAVIPFAMLDEPTLNLVKELLEKQEGEKNA